MKRPEVFLWFLLPLDGMLVHPRVIPTLNLPVSIYTPGWRETLWEWRVLPKNTTQYPGKGSNPDRSIWRWAHQPLRHRASRSQVGYGFLHSSLELGMYILEEASFFHHYRWDHQRKPFTTSLTSFWTRELIIRQVVYGVSIQGSGARFSKVPKSFRGQKAVAKSQTLWL